MIDRPRRFQFLTTIAAPALVLCVLLGAGARAWLHGAKAGKSGSTNDPR